MIKDTNKANWKRILIKFLIFVIVFIIAVLTIIYFQFASIFENKIKSFEIENMVLKEKIYINQIQYSGVGHWHEVYTVSTKKEEDDDECCNDSVEFVFNGDNAVSAYAILDSNIVIFVNIKSKEPRLFNSNINIIQIENEYTDIFRSRFPNVRIYSVDSIFNSIETSD